MSHEPRKEQPMMVQRTKTYAICPACGADAGCVDHLLNRRTETLWYCDTCGQRYQLTFPGDGTVLIALAQGRKVATVDVLVLNPQQKPVYFVVQGMRFEGEGDDRDEVESKRFFYEEHSCPTNWLKPVMVYFDGDSDPHGVVEFVATRDDATFPPNESYGPNARDAAIVEFIEKSNINGVAPSADKPR